MDTETHTPVALPPPPRIRSPAVASITRFDDQDEEDRRQRLLSRCTVQVVNVALLMTAVLLRRLIVRAEPRAGDAATDTIQQKVEKHTGVVFSRAHVRASSTRWWPLHWAFHSRCWTLCCTSVLFTLLNMSNAVNVSSVAPR